MVTPPQMQLSTTAPGPISHPSPMAVPPQDGSGQDRAWRNSDPGINIGGGTVQNGTPFFDAVNNFPVPGVLKPAQLLGGVKAIIILPGHDRLGTFSVSPRASPPPA